MTARGESRGTVARSAERARARADGGGIIPRRFFVRRSYLGEHLTERFNVDACGNGERCVWSVVNDVTGQVVAHFAGQKFARQWCRILNEPAAISDPFDCHPTLEKVRRYGEREAEREAIAREAAVAVGVAIYTKAVEEGHFDKKPRRNAGRIRSQEASEKGDDLPQGQASARRRGRRSKPRGAAR